MRNLLKKNQIIIYVIALMLVTAGYLSYNTYYEEESIQTIAEENVNNTEKTNIGDATLVNSNDIVSENKTQENINANNTTVQNTIDTNSTSQNLLEQNNQSNENIETQETSPETSQDDYFVKSKLQRDTMYSQMLETYEKVLNSANSLETQKQTATQEITKINEIKNKIMICENLINTKGFENSVIFVNGESISVIIKAKEIQKEEIAQIQNIIEREMNVSIENIHISTK